MDRYQAVFAQRTMTIIAIYHVLKNSFRLTEQIARFSRPLLLQCTQSVPENTLVAWPETR
jgi:hypothetical protein